MDATNSDKNIDRNLVGYCGLYCGACDILRLYREGRAAGRTSEWKDIPKRLRENLPFRPKPIICEGCSSDNVFGGCAICSFRKCAKKRGNVTLCTECDRYPCIRHHLFNLLVKIFSIYKKLPHQKTKEANLERIRCIGVDGWLAEQEADWRCPECGEPFTWYRSTCQGCGNNLVE